MNCDFSIVSDSQKDKVATFPNFISILPEATLGEHFRECQMSLWSGISVQKPCSPFSFIVTGIDSLLSKPVDGILQNVPKLPIFSPFGRRN